MSTPILLYTDDIESGRAEVISASGYVTQIFTSRLFEATLRDDCSADELQKSSPDSPKDLDDLSEMFAQAWRDNRAVRTAKGRASTSADEDPLDGGDCGLESAMVATPSRVEVAGRLEGEPAPTSSKMVGSVAVGIIVVSGPGALTFDSSELKTIIDQVVKSLGFLTDSAPPGRLTFHWELHALKISAAPDRNCGSAESCTAIWRDPALQLLGFPAGAQGLVDYANALKRNLQSNWSYVAFFTKYPAPYFGSAGPVALYVQYLQGRPERIPAVFAYLTCSIFGAASEHNGEGISCGCGPSGDLKVPNRNCVNCTSAQVPCLMNGATNLLPLCTWSRGQIGWWPRITGSGPKGAVAVSGGEARLFVTGDEGDLWLNRWWQGTSEWFDQGVPPNAALGPSMGTVSLGERTYQFVGASDGHLWARTLMPDLMWYWNDHGKPSSAALGEWMGTVVVGDAQPHVFVLGSDGDLWVDRWDNRDQKWHWDPLGNLLPYAIEGSMGAVTVDGDKPHVFVKASDGNLWCKPHTGTEWGAWSNCGRPHGLSIMAAMGAIVVDGRPHVFVIASDNNLWVGLETGNEWLWSPRGQPGTGPLAQIPVGAVVTQSGRPYVFAVGFDGLYACSLKNREWGWQKLPQQDFSVSTGAVAQGEQCSLFTTGFDACLRVTSGSDDKWTTTQMTFR